MSDTLDRTNLTDADADAELTYEDCCATEGHGLPKSVTDDLRGRHSVQYLSQVARDLATQPLLGSCGQNSD